MKRLSLFIGVLVCALCLASCSGGKTNEEIKWNINTEASGNGYLGITFPTGGVTAEGVASLDVFSGNDYALRECANAPAYGDVLENPDAYGKETLRLARKAESAVRIDSISGVWSVDIEGYVRYGSIILRIDEHFPKE